MADSAVCRLPMGKQRVLIFLPCFTHGGAERQGALLARYLRDEGKQVEVWGFPSLAGSAPLRATLEAWRVAHVELSAWPRFNWSFSRQAPSFLQRVRRAFWWDYQLRRFAARMPKREFDVVIPFTPWPCLAATLLRRNLNAETVVWNHRGGLDPGGIDLSPFIVEAVLSQRPTFVANSNIGAEFLRRTFALGADEVQLIRNAFMPEARDGQGLRAADASAMRPLELLHLANMFAEKDGETLLNAMGRLKSTGIRFHLHLAGFFPDSRYRMLLVKLARTLAIQDQVTFHGALDRDRVLQLLRQADVGLLSTRSEGMSNSIMEYMYWRLPVVATDIPGIREIVPEGHADWLFPVGDAARLAELIARLARDPQLRTRLGTAGRKRVEDDFAAAKILPQWMRLVEKAAQARAGK